MKQRYDMKTKGRVVEAGDRVYVQLRPTDRTWIRVIMRWTRANAVEAELEDGRVLQRQLDQVRR
ncbi:unnamed protein product [Dicrocoelium dendriticum]|nr:unnamed protein product [Dicrocoelium dendriticum]